MVVCGRKLGKCEDVLVLFLFEGVYFTPTFMSDDTTVAHIQVTQLKIEEAGGYVLVWLRIEFRHLQIGGAPPYQCYQSRSRRRNWLDGFLPMMSIGF